MKEVIRLSVVLLVALFAAGCARNEAAEVPSAPPSVPAAKVISKPITEFDEFTGRFEAVERVEVRPRVSGYVTAAQFEQGHEVKKGDILYVIDARPYQAKLKQAQAALLLTDNETTEQIAAATGSVEVADMGISGAMLGKLGGAAGAGWSNANEGKVIAAAFMDAHNQLVAQVRELQAKELPPAVATRTKG